MLVDEALGRAKALRLPPLAVGIGIYLPMAAILPVVIGAVIGYYYDRWADRTARPEFARRMGVLTATGLIVGESLVGVVIAAVVAGSGRTAPLALVGESFAGAGEVLGLAGFAAVVAVLYVWVARLSRGLSPALPIEAPVAGDV